MTDIHAQETARDTRIEQTTKVLLTILFLFLFAAFAWWQSDRIFELSPFDLVLLSLATLRLGRLIAYDLVTEPFRAPFARTLPDETGAGDSVEPHGRGARRALGQLISCPICAGTWIAAFLVYALIVLPQPTRIFLALTAAIGLAEILNGLIEAVCWSGQLSRTQAGSLLIAKREKDRQNQASPSNELAEKAASPLQPSRNDPPASPD
jgi:hypothetical protein